MLSFFEPFMGVMLSDFGDVNGESEHMKIALADGIHKQNGSCRRWRSILGPEWLLLRPFSRLGPCWLLLWPFPPWAPWPYWHLLADVFALFGLSSRFGRF